MFSFVVLCLLLGAGHVLRSRIKLLQKLYLPSCVVAGLLGLVIIQLFAAMDDHGGATHQINLALTAMEQTAGFSYQCRLRLFIPWC